MTLLKTNYSVLSVFLMTLMLPLFSIAQGPEFISVWNSATPAAGTNSNTGTTTTQIQYPGIGSNYTIQWEEVGNPSHNGTLTGNNTTLIEFGMAGTYTVKVTPGAGSFTGIRMPARVATDNYDRQKLVNITQWGNATTWSMMSSAFRNCINLDITATDVPLLGATVTSFDQTFDGCSKLVWNSSVNNWNVSNVTNMYRAFYRASVFNQPLNNWNVSKVTDMSGMFFANSVFNQPLNNWDVSNVTNMSQMFYNASVFNQPLGSWNVSKVTNMDGMFVFTNAFNQPLNSWNVSSVTNMNNMFTGARAFNQPLDSWDVSKVTNMSGMFNSTIVFNQPLDSWNVSSVTTMIGMFAGTQAFNQPLNSWDVSNVTNMNGMFQSSRVFSQPLDSWDVGKVTNMSSLFDAARAFNQPLDSWDVSKVTNTTNMFRSAAAFNQPLDSWTLSALTAAPSMLQGSGLDCVNYGKTLRGWAANPVTPNNITGFVSTGLTYGDNGAAARSALTAKGWVISDDSFAPGCDAALPVVFGNITASLRSGVLQVNWQTQSETNVSHFDIMASADGEIFTKIGTVDSKAENGNSNIELSYSFSRAVDNSLMAAGVLLLLSGGLFLSLCRKRKLLFGGLMLLGVGLCATGCSKKDNATVQQGKVYVQIVHVDKDGSKSSSKVVLAFFAE